MSEVEAASDPEVGRSPSTAASPSLGVGREASRTAGVQRLWRRLYLFCFVLSLGTSVGTLFLPLGSIGETRVADWIDLLTPFAVIGCAVLVLSAADAGRGPQIVKLVGSIAFTLGHGLHLAANSISNVDDEAVAEAPIVHLWDEVVSHYVSSTGLYLVLVAFVWAMRAHQYGLSLGGWAVAVVLAVALVHSYIEGDVAWLGIAFLASAVVAGLWWERSMGSLLALTVGVIGLPYLTGWGLYWYLMDGTVFPEFSDLGWI